MSHGQATFAPYNNLFESCHVKHGDDNHAPGIRVKCGKCGNVLYQYVNRNVKGPPDDAAIVRKVVERLESLGWRIGNNISHHRCPVCVSRAAQMRAVHAGRPENKLMAAALAAEKNGNVVDLPVPPAVVSHDNTSGIPDVSKREMSRPDRRVILLKLQDVYVDEKSGYKTPWTDLKVAEDLGIPIEWVRQLREENFGVVATNPQIEAVLTEGRAWRHEFAEVAGVLADKFKALDAKLGGLIERMDALEKGL
jgi:hypothetical protein